MRVTRHPSPSKFGAHYCDTNLNKGGFEDGEDYFLIDFEKRDRSRQSAYLVNVIK